MTANAAVAPPMPVPRNYTDEELKQQYGIHMATRLGADEEGDRSKWADIDDDEDDWAPETVTWLDGTKSTVAAMEAKTVNTEAPIKQTRQIRHPEMISSGERPRLKLQPQSQPRVQQSQPRVQQAQQSEQAQQIQQSQPPALTVTTSEEPPLLLIPIPPSTSVKTILKPGSHALAQKASGTSGLKTTSKPNATASGAPAPMPAKSPWAPLPPVDKVSPVTFVPPPQPQKFSRDPSGSDVFHAREALSPKEIEADDFNRFSNQPRRRELFNSQSGEFEPASGARKGQPRQEHSHRQPAVLQRNSQGQPNPAEPSANFQGRRGSGPDVSHANWQRRRTDSINSSGRRMSVGRPHETIADRSDIPPSLSTPRDADHQGVNGIAPAQSPAPVNAAQQESDPDVHVYMKEKIERARLAKQQRMEEEEREEKARKERLRLKMESLAALARPSVEAKETPQVVDNSVASPPVDKAIPITSPPKPPVPTVRGEVAQYGVMKVHHSHPVKQNAANETGPNNRGGPGSRLGRRQSSHEEKATQKAEQVQKLHTSSEQSQISTTDTKRAVAAQEQASPWRTSGPQEGFNGWGSSSSSNVWGPPPSKDRALGNGTFDNSGFNTLPGGSQVSRAVGTPAAFTPPGPIGPPSGPASMQGGGRHGQTKIDRAHVQHGEISPPNSLEHREPHNFVNQSPHRGQRQQNQFDHSVHDKLRSTVGGSHRQHNAGHDANAQAVASGWNTLVQQTQENNEQTLRSYRQSQQNFEFGTVDVLPTYGQIGSMDHRRTLLGAEGPQTRNENFHNEKPTNGTVVLPGQLGLSAPSGLTGPRPAPIGSSSKDQQMPGQVTAPLSQRSSRFFPRNETIENTDKTNSPPPPEISSLDTGLQHQSPRVNIPKVAVVAVVKLPPSIGPSSPGPVVVADGPGSPLARSGDWQSKFNTLFKKDGSAAVATSPPPTRRNIFSLDRSPNPQTRELDEDLYPQPEFGSTPTIRLPSKSYVYPELHRNPSLFNSQKSVLVRQFREAEIEFTTSKAMSELHELGDKPNNNQRPSFVIRIVPGAEPKIVHAQSYSPKPHNNRGGFRERRGQDSSSHGRGNRRTSTQYQPREGSFGGSMRGNPHRGGSRGGHHSKRNMTAPVAVAQ